MDGFMHRIQKQEMSFQVTVLFVCPSVHVCWIFFFLFYVLCVIAHIYDWIITGLFIKCNCTCVKIGVCMCACMCVNEKKSDYNVNKIAQIFRLIYRLNKNIWFTSSSNLASLFVNFASCDISFRQFLFLFQLERIFEKLPAITFFFFIKTSFQN